MEKVDKQELTIEEYESIMEKSEEDDEYVSLDDLDQDKWEVANSDSDEEE